MKIRRPHIIFFKNNKCISMIIKTVLFCSLFFLNAYVLYAQQANPTVAVVNLHVPGDRHGTFYASSVNRSEEMVGAITTSLVQSRRFRVIERSRIDQIIREQGFQRSELSDDQVIRIGRLLGVQKIVTGEFPNFTATSVAGGTISIRLIDVETGFIEAAASQSVRQFQESFVNTAIQLVQDLLR